MKMKISIWRQIGHIVDLSCNVKNGQYVLKNGSKQRRCSEQNCSLYVKLKNYKNMYHYLNIFSDKNFFCFIFVFRWYVIALAIHASLSLSNGSLTLVWRTEVIFRSIPLLYPFSAWPNNPTVYTSSGHCDVCVRQKVLLPNWTGLFRW